MLGINRLFVADREEGGLDGFLLAPVDRTALLVAKALALLRLPRRARARRGARLRAAAARPRPRRGHVAAAGCSCCCSRTSGSPSSGRWSRRSRCRPARATCSSRCSRLPLLHAGGHRRRAGDRAAVRGGGRRGAPRPLAGGARRSMIWSSGCSPTPSSTSSSRTSPTPCDAQALRDAPRPARLTAVALIDRLRAWPSSTRRWTPTRASCRRSSTSTCRWRSWRCAASSLGGVMRDPAPAHAATAARTCAATSRSTCRSILGVGVLITGAIWAKASWGHWWVWDEPTLVSFLIVFLLYAMLPAAALLDRGPRAPGALRVGVRDHRRRVRAAELHRRAARRRRRSTRACFATADGGLPGEDAARLPRLPRRHGAAVRDAVALRDGRQAGVARPLRSLRRRLGGDDAVPPPRAAARPPACPSS